MKLKELLGGCTLRSFPESAAEAEVTGISSDSRSVKEGDIYVCLRGSRYDGHDFAAQAVLHGASFILAERNIDSVENVIITDDTRRALSIVCNNFYGILACE